MCSSDLDEYNIRADLNLLPNRGFISSLRFVGGEVERYEQTVCNSSTFSHGHRNYC